MYYQRSSAFIGGLQSDRHRSPTTVWPQMNADKRRFARDLLRLSSYFLDTTLALLRAARNPDPPTHPIDYIVCDAPPPIASARKPRRLRSLNGLRRRDRAGPFC